MSSELEERGCSSNEEEDDDLLQVMRDNSSISTSFPFLSPSSSSTSQSLWLRNFDSQRERDQPPAAADSVVDRNFHFVDLSLRTSNEESTDASGSEIKPVSHQHVEKEHMFDKVVTPSDVGKLNRLVIPKQHAEKYFPLDSSSTEKGLLLNFEDRNGKSWRFRYSYWNSSQSYVMTKGWSRFVKEKKLDAGDIVSFQRGVGEVGRSHFFIDWRRRPDVVLPDPGNFGGYHFQNQFSFVPPSVRWGRLYSLPQTASLPRSFEPSPRLNFAGYNPYDHHQYQHRYQQEQRIIQPPELRSVGYGNVPHIYARSSSNFPSGPRIGTMAQEAVASTVIESVPVVVPANKTDAGKRLRLFGVNMECGTEDDSSSSSSSSLHSRMHAECSKKGKSSLSFDLDH